jgi:hypothetical protein
LFFCSFSFGHCVFCPSNYGLSPLTVWVRPPLRRGLLDTANSMTNHNPVRQTPMKQKTTNCNSIIMNHNPNRVRVSVVLSCLTPLSKIFFWLIVVIVCLTGLDLCIWIAVWPSWSWSSGTWTYDYLWNQCLLPLTLWVRIPPRCGILNTTFSDKDCQRLAACRWFQPKGITTKSV